MGVGLGEDHLSQLVINLHTLYIFQGKVQLVIDRIRIDVGALSCIRGHCCAQEMHVEGGLVAAATASEPYPSELQNRIGQ